MRDFSKSFNEKTLKFILQNLFEEFETEGLDIDDYDDYCVDVISQVVRYFGVSNLEWDEASFFIKLMQDNPNYETEPIKVPSPSKLEVFVEVDMIQYINEVWKHEVETYFNEKEYDMVNNQLTNHEDYSYWGGNEVGHDIYDSHINDEKIIQINKLK